MLFEVKTQGGVGHFCLNSLFCINIHFGNFESVFNNKIPDTSTITKQMSKACFLFISTMNSFAIL
jgi:hypothetical protein